MSARDRFIVGAVMLIAAMLIVAHPVQAYPRWWWWIIGP